MIGIVAFCRSDEEKEHIRSAAADLALRYDWADSNLIFCENPEMLHRTEDMLPADIVFCDVTVRGAAQALKELRRDIPETAIVPIADAAVPPTEYVRPDIMPCSLLWRPFDRRAAAEALSAAFQHRRASVQQEKPESCFVLKTKTGTRRIPFARILFFEAREKKLFLRLAGGECSFPGTLSSIEETLPETFARCHKSFIVNCERIRAVRHDLQCIEMDEAEQIPYSRGYRKQFMERFYERID